MERSSKVAGRRFGLLLLILGLILVANGAYLAAFATPDVFYVFNSFLHPLLGVAVAILFILFLLHHRSAFRDGLGTLLMILGAVAFGSGMYLAVAGMTSRDPRVLDIHVAFSIAALLVVLAFLRKRSRAQHDPQQVSLASTTRKAWRWSIVVMAASLGLYVGATLTHRFFPNPYYIIQNPKSPPATMAQEGGGSHSLVWPSSAQVGGNKPMPTDFFLSSKSCEPCHSTIYHEWFHSMHHYSSFNNQWYRKTIEYMQDTVGIKPSMWCGGCHDQAISFTGAMETHPIRELEDTPAGQNGLGCVSCHGIVHVDSTMGQADFTMIYPPLDKYAQSSDFMMQALHYYDLKLNPKAHVSAFFKPFMVQHSQQAEFCSTCHKVHQDVPVNHYRWARGFDEYDNWQASGTDWLGARSFYYPPKPMNCVDCHMPLVKSNDFGNINGYVHSHEFAAANTAVPTSHGDKEQVAAVEHFLKGALSVDIFALAEEPSQGSEARGATTTYSAGPQLSTNFAVGEESGRASAAPEIIPLAKLIAPLGAAKAVVHPGETVRVEVVVRTLRLGHFFPGGTVDAYDCWLELKATDSKGRVIFWSGEAADGGKGPVDPAAHFYHSVQLDAHGNNINKRDTWLTRAVVYTHLIPPGAADVAHYRLKVPADCGGSITLTAKLNYRKFSWWNTQWAFAGVRDPNDPHYARTASYDDGRWVFTGSLAGVSAKIKQIPDVPTVVIAEQTRTLPVTKEKDARFVPDIAADRGDMIRWNDYGIGLLLQGDLKGAERAFRIVTEIDPKYADGRVNVARAMIQEGNTDAAKPLLEKALALNPKLGSALYFYGLALKADGNYAAAEHEFALAAARYPKDRVVRNQMGEMDFLQRKYKPAMIQFQQALEIDPENLFAHYNMMLCYMGMGQPAGAKKQEKLYLRFKANEIARSITGPYRLTRPDDNNESQPIHEHVSVPLNEINHPPAYWYSPYLPQTAPHAATAAASRRSASGRIEAVSRGGAGSY